MTPGGLINAGIMVCWGYSCAGSLKRDVTAFNQVPYRFRLLNAF